MKTKTPSLKPIALAISTALAAGATGVAQADANPFAVRALSAGYMLDGFADPATGSAPAKKDEMKDSMKKDDKAKEGKCGEGKCGADKMKAKEGKCGEGKCGGDKKGAHVHAKGEKIMEGKCGEGKCGEGKCGGDMKAKEGSCGAEHMKGKEGSCGGDKKKDDAKKDGKKN